MECADIAQALNPQQLFEALQIDKVLYIDDKIDELTPDQLELAREFIRDNIFDADFENLLIENLSQEITDQLKNGDFSCYDGDGEIQRTIIGMLKKNKPLIFENLGSGADIIRKNLEEFFNPIRVDAFRNYAEVKEKDYKLIIMDYSLGPELNALHVIKDLISDNQFCNIVLLSSHQKLEYEGKEYDMGDHEKKQALFREYSSNNSLEFKALLNYISKDYASDHGGLNAELSLALLEFESGKIMIDVIKELSKLLNDGVNQVVKELLLTNTKTMKALITDKLEKEGVSETTYLVDFSLSLVKNLISKEIGTMETIHDQLQKIRDWECNIWDYETDEHIRKLRRLQILDENISKRFAPIDFGDIFEIDIGERDKVMGLLVSQSCDLIIRNESRALKRNDNWATIVLSVPKSNGQACCKTQMGKEHIIWDVRKKIVIPTEILDLTSLNIDGVAAFTLNQEVSRKFSWSSVYSLYMQKVVEELSREFGEFADGQTSFWVKNGLGFPLTRNGNDVSFKIKRVSRLDYLQSLTVLKLYSHIQTRIPLMMDPSDQLIKIAQSKLNDQNCPLNFYYQDESYFMEIDNVEEKLTNKGYSVPEGFQDIVKNKFDDHLHYKLSQQYANRLLIINEATLPNLQELGFSIDMDKANKRVLVNFIYVPKLKCENEEFNTFHSVKEGEDVPKICVKKEEISDYLDSLGVVIDEDDIELTHPRLYEILQFKGKMAILKIG